VKASASALLTLPRRLYFIAAAIWALFILYALLTPGSDVPSIQLWMGDKIVHAILFFIQMALVWKCIAQGAVLPHRALGYAFLITVLFGMTTELLQLLAVERSADAFDAVADAGGALLFWALIEIRDSRRKKQA